MIMKFRKKPVVIEAVQWTGTNREEIRTFCTHGAFFVPTRQDTEGRSTEWSLLVDSIEGIMYANVGDYTRVNLMCSRKHTKRYNFHGT